MSYCSVPKCKSDKKIHLPNGISFHEFPSNEETRKKWIKAISRKDPQSEGLWLPKSRSTICSLHFTAESFKNTPKRKILHSGSVPTIFPGYPKYMVPVENTYKRRRLDKVDNAIHNSRSSNLCTVQGDLCQNSAFHPMSSPDELVNLQLLADVAVATQSPSINQPTANMSVCEKKCRKFKKKYDTAQRTVRRLKFKVAKLKAENEALKQENKKFKDRLDLFNLSILEKQAIKANFLRDQLIALNKKKMHWSDETVRYTVLLHHKSPSTYRFLRKMDILSLPSPTTLKRYIGNCNSAGISSLIKQRLHQEFSKLTDKEIFGSLLIDEMKIKPAANYLKFSDTVVGMVRMNGLEEEAGLQDKLATQLLCFLFCGISTCYRIPVGYFFTYGLKGTQLYQLALQVMKEVENAGFVVLRIVTDNHKTNTALFREMCGGHPVPKIPHPLNDQRVLFLSYDFCHVLKNIRNQFVSHKRPLCNKGERIDSRFLEEVSKMQKDWVIKPVRHLSEKHLHPNNLQKMNVKLAVQLFSTETVSVLKFLHEYGVTYGIKGFENCGATILFLEHIQKWFSIHNVKNTTSHIYMKNPPMQQFFSIDDERLNWLETDFLMYLQQWKESAQTPLHFFTDETYAAIQLTTKSTVECVRYLLTEGFHYVLTRKFSSDDVESLFSAVRQLNGSNDTTNAANCISSLHKILVTGLIQSSQYASVKNADMFNKTENLPKLFRNVKPNLPTNEIQSVSKTIENVKYLLKEKLVQIEDFKYCSIRGVKAAALAVIAGYLTKCIDDNMECFSCKQLFVAPNNKSPLLGIIRNLDRGGLIYPKPQLVGFLTLLEAATNIALPLLVHLKNIQTTLSSIFLPHMIKNKIFCCEDEHQQELCTLILKKFLRPYISNYCNNKTSAEQRQFLNKLPEKPLSRKILKLQ